MNLALLGYGSIAQSHMNALRGEDVKMHVVMGRVAESAAAFAAEYGFQRFTTDLADAVTDSAVDAVLITSPSDLHAEQAEMALRAGKHVLVEIPLATNLGDVDRLTELADERNLRLMVCHTQRYYPGLMRARAEIASGRLYVHHITCRYMFLRRENVNWKGRQRSWTDNLLWHHGCHAVDTALWLLGVPDAVEPIKMQVDGHMALPSRHLGIPMDLGIIIRTPADQLVTISMSYNTHIPQNDVLIIGEENTLHYADRRLVTKDAVLYEPSAEGAPSNDSIADQDREFLVAVREGREPAVSGRSVRPAMQTLQTVQDQFEDWAPPGATHPIGN